MKKSQTRVIRVFIFCTLLAANWLALLPGSATVFAKPADLRPAGLPKSRVIDPPNFNQDNKNGCQDPPKDLDRTAKTDPKFHNGMAHYHVLTINKGGSQCDHLSWDINNQNAPKAAMITCQFFMQFAGIDSKTGFKFKFRDNRNNVITTSKDPSVPGNGSFDVKGVHVVQADLSGIGPKTKIDVGTLFVDCDSDDLKKPVLS